MERTPSNPSPPPPISLRGVTTEDLAALDAWRARAAGPGAAPLSRPAAILYILRRELAGEGR